ncbi:hypothetical protein [Olivibacter sitiensis]|uniref:hypothetical protein n=1 Tax=Olivibacter sitiensis TaxID=376470 RepID=UPI000401EE44|nr:hypothetical protein [Olivibacter sitiensis]
MKENFTITIEVTAQGGYYHITTTMQGGMPAVAVLDILASSADNLKKAIQHKAAYYTEYYRLSNQETAEMIKSINIKELVP